MGSGAWQRSRRGRAAGVHGVIGLVVVVVLSVDAFAVVGRGGQESPPSFRAGGAFADVPVADSSTTASTSLTAGPVALPPAPPSTTIAAVPRLSVTTSVPRTTTTVTRPAPQPSPPARATPVPGVYTYALRGSEAATVLGARPLGPQMTVTVHGAAGLVANQVVLDYALSPNHREREIVTFGDDGLAFSFEGGSVSFGPATQTSQADFSPPLLQVPFPLVAATVRSGSSTARDAAGGTSRVEDWSATVVGQDTVSVGGQAIPTWVVRTTRRTRPGSNDQLTRTRTYWYDPARHIWIKVEEHFQGHRSLLALDFGFTADFEATLVSFP